MHKSKQTTAARRIHRPPAATQLTIKCVEVNTPPPSKLIHPGGCGAGLHLTQKSATPSARRPCWDVRFEQHLLPNPHLRGGARAAEPELGGDWLDL